MKKTREFGKANGLLLLVILGAALLSWMVLESSADSAGDLDYHSDVREAVAIADASSSICAEVDASGYLKVVDAALVADLAAIEVLITAGNVDLAALEVLLTASNVDLAAIEVLITAGNVDHAANEALLITIDADTSAIAVDQAAIEALLITMDADTGACATDLAAIEVLITAGNVDLAALEVDLAAIEVLNAGIETAVELIDNAIAGTEMQVDIVADQALTAAVDSVTNTPLAATGVVVITNDAVVKGSAGVLYGVRVAFDGVTAGDTVEIENHASADSGTSLLTFVAQAADENVQWFPCVGIAYAAGIYCDFTLTGGVATVSFVYE